LIDHRFLLPKQNWGGNTHYVKGEKKFTVADVVWTWCIRRNAYFQTDWEGTYSSIGSGFHEEAGLGKTYETSKKE